MANGSLKNKHIADLHELAAEEGVDGYRLLTRDQLIAKLGGDSGGESSGEDSRSDDSSGSGSGRGSRGGGGRSRGGRSRGDRDRDRERGRGRGRADDDGGSDRDDDEAPDDKGEPITGVLDITPRGHGFIRGEVLSSAEGDVYVSPSQIRRCELKRGDLIAGPARGPRRGERHPALIHIDTVNGVEPGAERSTFEDLEAVAPSRRLPLSGEGLSDEQAQLLRSIDLLTPLARGQRVLVRAERGSGRSTLLRALAAELSKADDLEVVVVLIDERPEEEKPWREAVPEAEISIATADMRPVEQLRTAELAIAQAKRRAESGEDVAILFDSLSRLATAADDPGVVKPIFAAGRETADEDSGSLTVIATVLTEIDDAGVVRALETTENVTITLSSELAAAGIYPALEIGGCRLSGEDGLREGAELAAARALRAELAALPARDAAERLRELLASASTNESLLSSRG